MRIIFSLALLSLSLQTECQTDSNATALYKTHCASCHGSELQGTGLGPKLSPSTYVYGGREDDFIRVISNGIPSQEMPSFKNTLNEEQIKTLANFLPSRSVHKPALEAEKSEEPHTSGVIQAPAKVSTLDYLVDIELVADGLETPWALAFISPTTILVSERPGRLRVVENGQLLARPIANTPEVLVSDHKWNQGGLLDIALGPKYQQTGWVYLSYSHSLSPKNKTTEESAKGMIRIVRGKIIDHTWQQEEVVYQAHTDHYGKNFWHYGGRMLFDPNGDLFFSVGDRGAREQARELSKPFGKIHRLHANGATPSNNPFLNTKNALPSVYSMGHRNPQGLAQHPRTGEVWITEHGPRGGDEINLLKPAGDYGWSKTSYGINYDGTLLTPHTSAPGIEQPLLYWRPSIGVSGLTFYQGDEFPGWRNKLLVTALATREIRLLTLHNNAVLHQETLATFEGRPYEAVVGPDGAIYIVTDSPGQLLRLSAAQERKI